MLGEERSAVIGETAPEHPPLATCRAVSVRHRTGGAEVVALRKVDLEIRAGEAIALLGPSGSGKTTLLHVLGGLLAPSEGAVTWKEARLSSLDADARSAARAEGISYVFQGANLLPTFTAFENVAFAAWASARASNHSHASTPAPALSPEALLGLVGLDEKLDALPAELSGGEAQRVAIARSLAQRPELLLCDEPTGQLDSDTAGRVLDLIEELQQRFGFALIVATHDSGVAGRYSREVQLSDGMIVDGQRSR